MPRTNLLQQHNPFITIAGAQVRAGMNDKQVYTSAGINHESWRKHKKDGWLSLAQIRAIDEVLGFTDSELIEIIRGKK